MPQEPYVTILQLPIAGALVGTEPFETVQGGISVQTTATAIAALAAINVEEEGSVVVTSATTMNFIGPAVTVTDAGGGQANVTVDVTSSATLTLTDNTPTDLVDNDNPLNIGAVDPSTSQHLALDLTSVQSKTNATTAGILTLNQLGGDVRIGAQSGTGTVELYNDGFLHVSMNEENTFFRGDGTSGVGNAQNTKLTLENQNGVALAVLGFDSILDFRLDSLNNGAEIQLRANDGGGTLRNLIVADPDDDVKLYDVGVEVARTNTAALGGLFANNLATGAGFERVLTTSDLGGVSGVNKLPDVDVLSLGAARYIDINRGEALEGFLGNGDYVTTPTATGDTLEYFNAAGVSQWTVSKANINAAVDAWVGFYLDATANLLYIVGVDVTTTPNTFYTASVNTAGTVVNIGNAQPAADFSIATGDHWNVAQNVSGATIATRDVDGSGNIFVRMTVVTTGMEEMEINITTGAIASDPAVIDGNSITPGEFAAYKSADNIYYYVTSVAVANLEAILLESGITYPETDIPFLNGTGQEALVKMMLWKGYVAACTPIANVFEGPRFWSKTNFDTFVLAIRNLY